jgi:hypothetical protein
MSQRFLLTVICHNYQRHQRTVTSQRQKLRLRGLEITARQNSFYIQTQNLHTKVTIIKEKSVTLHTHSNKAVKKTYEQNL